MTMGPSNIGEEDGRLSTSVQVLAREESCRVRQCPKCLRAWPTDWDYCAGCAISIQGREITKAIIRLAPSDSWGPVAAISIRARGKYAAGLFLACDFRCDADPPSPENFQRGKTLMDIAVGAIAGHSGVAWLLADLGIVGCWEDVGGNIDMAVRAAAEILENTTSGKWAMNWGQAGVSLGIGIVSLPGLSKSRNEAMSFAFRLASLGHPDSGLVSEAIYAATVERFDYQGVCPVVPKSDPLPEAVFKLVGPKPERSGTHYEGPDTAPLVGRHELLRMLHDCRQDIADGGLVVVHLIGDPGVGKSRLLREWLRENERLGRLAGWIRLHVHGVPYGGYPLRAWSRLTNSLMGSDADGSESVLNQPTFEDVINRLCRLTRPALMVIDDLHWIDAASRCLLARLLDAPELSPLFAIFAYRPSFVSEAPYGNPRFHRRVFLEGLGRTELSKLTEALASERKTQLPAAWREEIARKARGNPLYASEAIGYLAEARTNASPDALPSSLAELLIQRIQRVLDTTLPRIEHEVRLSMARLAFAGDSESILRRLEKLEEQLASWLDRLDVVEQESASLVQKFLRGLKEIDGSLALLNIFLGRQRPHHYRLAQALARVESLNGPDLRQKISG